jgi:hypothetical protein
MSSSVYVKDAPCARASVRRGVVEARTMGARMVEFVKRAVAASWAGRMESADVIVVEMVGVE